MICKLFAISPIDKCSFLQLNDPSLALISPWTSLGNLLNRQNDWNFVLVQILLNCAYKLMTTFCVPSLLITLHRATWLKIVPNVLFLSIFEVRKLTLGQSYLPFSFLCTVRLVPLPPSALLSPYGPLCICVGWCAWECSCCFLHHVFVFVLRVWPAGRLSVCLPEWNVSLISLLLLEGRKRRALLCNLSLHVAATQPPPYLGKHIEAFKHLTPRIFCYNLITFCFAWSFLLRMPLWNGGWKMANGLVKSIKKRTFDWLIDCDDSTWVGVD